MKNIMLFLICLCTVGCVSQTETDMINMENKEVITLGAGCFWCVEAVFTELEGVESVVSGYTGGTVKNPSYKEVCNGTTGHAEVAQIVFDPEVISLKEILEVFWKTHDNSDRKNSGG